MGGVMATKTSKRVGETSTTVSVGIRIDPKVKFALDMMGRLQKRSLTAVVEWAISNAMSQQAIDSSRGSVKITEAIDAIWSTDEATRFINMCYEVPTMLTYDEHRLWDTIQLSKIFWTVGYATNYREHLNEWKLRLNWQLLKEHVEEHKNSPSVEPFDDIPF
jgi:predicted transcriptional regulator